MSSTNHNARTAWNGEPGWPRPRKVPVTILARPVLAPSCFVQETPEASLSANTERLQTCYDNVLCQVCGESVLAIDDRGWVLTPEANMGGACCTRCMYLAVRVCPNLRSAPFGGYTFWAITEAAQYEWFTLNGYTKGKIIPCPDAGAVAHSWMQFSEHYGIWKSAWNKQTPHSDTPNRSCLSAQ